MVLLAGAPVLPSRHRCHHLAIGASAGARLPEEHHRQVLEVLELLTPVGNDVIDTTKNFLPAGADAVATHGRG
jgi:hypothetical protein